MRTNNQTGIMKIDGVEVYYTEIIDMDIISMSWCSLINQNVYQSYFHGHLEDSFAKGAELIDMMTEYKRMQDPVVNYNLVMDAEIVNWVTSAAPEHIIINMVCSNGTTTIELSSKDHAASAYESLIDSIDGAHEEYLEIVLDGNLIRLYNVSSQSIEIKALRYIREELEQVLNNLDRIELASANSWLGWLACVVDRELELTIEEFTKLKEEGEALVRAAEL